MKNLIYVFLIILFFNNSCKSPNNIYDIDSSIDSLPEKTESNSEAIDNSIKDTLFLEFWVGMSYDKCNELEKVLIKKGLLEEYDIYTKFLYETEKYYWNSYVFFGFEKEKLESITLELENCAGKFVASYGYGSFCYDPKMFLDIYSEKYGNVVYSKVENQIEGFYSDVYTWLDNKKAIQFIVNYIPKYKDEKNYDYTIIGNIASSGKIVYKGISLYKEELNKEKK